MPPLELDTRSMLCSHPPRHKPPSRAQLCWLLAGGGAVLAVVAIMCSGIITDANITAAVAVMWVPVVNGWW